MRFVITGVGRSGTMWMARELARSRTYIVRHEHADDARGWFRLAGCYDQAGHLRITAERFRAHDNYGEVNACLRFIVGDLPVDKRAVIIRNPMDIALSSLNKFPIRWMGMAGFTERCTALEADLRQVQKLVDAHYPCFRFEECTKFPERMVEIVDWLGLTDVDSLAFRYAEKLNASGREFCSNIAQLLPAHRQALRRACKWFADIHYPNTWRA